MNETSTKKIRILKTEIAPGKRTVLNIDIARLHTRTKIEVPVIVERGLLDGPTLLITGGIHGDEINGVEIVRQIIAKGYNKPTAGMIICIPVVNVFGFLNQERALPDGRDLNRSFPGNANGSLAARFAHSLVGEILPHVDYCLDYHTGGAARFNYSQVRVNATDPASLDLAAKFGAKFIVNATHRERSLREIATELGKKVLLFEGGKTHNLDRQVTAVGIYGAARIIHHLGLRTFAPATLNTAFDPKPILIKDSAWVRAKHSGMYRSSVRVGAWVNRKDKIGSISDPFGEFEKVVTAPHEGYVICSNHAPIVNQGDALAHISRDIDEFPHAQTQENQTESA